MKTYYKLQQRKPKPEDGPVSRQLKICVACGNTRVEEYEFGISCEFCGTSFYFGRIDDAEVKLIG